MSFSRAGACARLEITLLHAKPYDPQARGKMERFWRTLRDGLLSYLDDVASLAEINRQLQAFLDRRYHVRPHPSLPGKSPAKVYATRGVGEGAIDEAAFRIALTERTRRHVSGDNVISFDGIAYELDQGFLAGKNVTVAQCFATPDEPPWVEHEGKRLALRVLDTPSASSSPGYGHLAMTRAAHAPRWLSPQRHRPRTLRDGHQPG